MKKPALYFCHLPSWPVMRQLQLEEALLRQDQDNWCLINYGSSPAVVMGISSQPELFIEREMHARYSVPIIRRFSGGGTVLIEETTLLVTLILARASVCLGPCPRKLLQWTCDLFAPAFLPAHIEARENDYVIGEQKIGGNAQYFTKDRCLHHTSFVWDYDATRMQLLKMPPKVPEYRGKRDHEQFLGRLKAYLPSVEGLITALGTTLHDHFLVQHVDAESVGPLMERPHRKSVEEVVFYTAST